RPPQRGPSWPPACPWGAPRSLLRRRYRRPAAHAPQREYPSSTWGRRHRLQVSTPPAWKPPPHRRRSAPALRPECLSSNAEWLRGTPAARTRPSPATPERLPAERLPAEPPVAASPSA